MDKAEVNIIVDIEKISFDEILEMAAMFSGFVDSENDAGGKIFEKYKPLIAYFAYGDDGERLEKDIAAEIIGKMPAVKILPHMGPIIEAVTKLTLLLNLPEAKSGN